jgi:hypothetical protein
LFAIRSKKQIPRPARDEAYEGHSAAMAAPELGEDPEIRHVRNCDRGCRVLQPNHDGTGGCMSEFGKVAVLMGRVRRGAAERLVREDEAAAHRRSATQRSAGNV